MNDELLNMIEEALDIKFYDWQRQYLLKEPMLLNMRITGRGTGKTLVYVIEQLFEGDEPLYLRTETEVMRQCDWWSVSSRYQGLKYHPYISWYRRYVLDIKSKLDDKHIKTREIIF